MRNRTIAITAGALLALPAVAGAADDTTPPAKTCEAERAAIGVTAFPDLYGTNKSKANAFGTCVPQAAKAKRGAQEADRVNAAERCKAEKEADAAAFAEKYGSRRDAFGTCVSKAAKA